MVSHIDVSLISGPNDVITHRGAAIVGRPVIDQQSGRAPSSVRIRHGQTLGLHWRSIRVSMTADVPVPIRVDGLRPRVSGGSMCRGWRNIGEGVCPVALLDDYVAVSIGLVVVKNQRLVVDG